MKPAPPVTSVLMLSAASRSFAVRGSASVHSTGLRRRFFRPPWMSVRSTAGGLNAREVVRARNRRFAAFFKNMSTNPGEARVLVISPVRNESAHIARVVRALAGQCSTPCTLAGDRRLLDRRNLRAAPRARGRGRLHDRHAASRGGPGGRLARPARTGGGGAQLQPRPRGTRPERVHTCHEAGR